MERYIPHIFKPMINEYVRMLKDTFGKDYIGTYIYGSMALESFNYKTSDINFITVLAFKPDKKTVEKLKRIHAGLIKVNVFARKMQGEYVSVQELGQAIDKEQFMRFRRGRFAGYHKLTVMTLYQIRALGICLYGPEPMELFPTVDLAMVMRSLNIELQGYWQQVPEQKYKLLTDKWVMEYVLGLCRTMYMIDTKSMITKYKAGEYALSVLPEKWHKILNESLRIQYGARRKSLYTTPFSRRKEAINFIYHTMQLCSSRMEEMYKKAAATAAIEL